MKFMITYVFPPEHREETQDRFRKTGGQPGGADVKMLGRWHAVAGNAGFVLAETADAVALGKWLQEWTDMLTFEVIPVNDDEEVMKVIGQ